MTRCIQAIGKILFKVGHGVDEKGFSILSLMLILGLLGVFAAVLILNFNGFSRADTEVASSAQQTIQTLSAPYSTQ
jgi:type II secretory pathway pseudopilin PulG